MKKFIQQTVLLLTVLLGTTATTQAQQLPLIPKDPDLIIRKLDKGLTH